MRSIIRSILILILSVILTSDTPAQPSEKGTASTSELGLKVTFIPKNPLKSDNRRDVRVQRNLAVYVPKGESPTPFLGKGAFQAIFEGSLSAPIRSFYTFKSRHNGHVRLELNGKTIIEADDSSDEWIVGKRARLNKGDNSIRLVYESPAEGDAYFRVYWEPRRKSLSPIPAKLLSHISSEETRESNVRRQGRALMVEKRCFHCHALPQSVNMAAENDFGAPSFKGIGSRLNPEWMARWILDPQSIRKIAVMPKMLHGETAAKDALAIAAYLGSLKSVSDPTIDNASTSPESIEHGGPFDEEWFFEELSCGACHLAPESNVLGADLISLQHLGQKFKRGALANFLMQPNRHYSRIRMPDFKLSIEESSGLAAFLLSDSPPFSESELFSDPNLVKIGAEKIQAAGCLNCHDSKSTNQYSAKAFDEFSEQSFDRGCLGEETKTGIPRYELSHSEKSALKHFASHKGLNIPSLSRPSSFETAEIQVKHLRCRQCHGHQDGFPPVDIIGGKIAPEWIQKLLSGTTNFKTRHWLKSRMPAFPAYAEVLSKGLAVAHGFSPKTPEREAFDPEAAKIGRKLVSSDGGFNCVACHAISDALPTAVFESEGINLAYSVRRLNTDYFQRWMVNPLGIKSQTKMPAFFEGGFSPLGEYYGGDTKQQLRAIWHYMRLEDNMPAPFGYVAPSGKTPIQQGDFE